MTDKSDSPCAGCRFARWYEHAQDYGECDHPQAVAHRARPMVLGDRRSTAIQRHWIHEPSPDACPAREAA